jgi:anaerobic magnesium-protoporphyrin IX monomethyl ester cyclase
MIRKNLPIQWVCYVNPGLLDHEVLKLMKRAGCHTVIIGVEDENIERLKERYQRNLSRSKLVEFCHQCNWLNIRICGDFIIGLDSDETAVNRMIQFAKTLQLDYASFNILTPLLGSKIREKLIEKGTLDPYTIGFDTSGTFGQGTEKLIQLRNMAIKKFYLRPKYLLRRMMNITSFTEFMIQFQEMIAMFRHHVLKRKTS